MVRSHVYTHVRSALLAVLGLSACGRPAVGNGDEDEESGSGSTAGSQTEGETGADASEDGSGESATSGMPVECEVCDGFEPVFQDGEYTGFHNCPDGTVHRHHLGSCEPTNAAPACNGDEAILSCVTDADCTDGPNGKCVHQSGFKSPEASCGCEYACETDEDCGTGQACICTGLDADTQARPVCVDVHCFTGDDCDSGECGLSAYNDGCGPVVTLQCRADEDLCRLDGDCESDPLGQFCAIPWGASDWQCVTYDCAAGRPYTVEGEARTASLVNSEVWNAPLSGTPQVVATSQERLELRAYWSKLAAFEHASVASFNRFALQLLALGAPPELLRATQLAAADEVRHAQLAFGLASRYAGQALGPGPMRLEVHTSFERVEVLRGLIEEGCVGETLGAIEAQTAAGACRDSQVRAILEEIASDELRHAQLAWETLRWILESDASLRPVARESFASSVAELRAKRSQGAHLPEHGVISGEVRDRVLGEALDEVVLPLAETLLAQLDAGVA